MRVMDPALTRDTRRARRMQRRHDPTYYFATRRLPAEIRPATHALYGYVRTADQIVDGPRRAATPADRRAALDAWEAELEAGATRCQPIVARARRRRRAPRAPARRAAHLHALDADRLRARCGSTAGTSSRPTWTARPARSGGSWPRCSASRAPPRRPRPARASRSSSRTSSATCARTRASTASTCPRRTARASASATPTSPPRSHAGGARAARPRGRARPRPVRRRRARRSPPRPLGAARHPPRDRALRAACSTASRRSASTCSAAAPACASGTCRGAALGGAAMTRRATLRGAERTPLDDAAPTC